MPLVPSVSYRHRQFGLPVLLSGLVIIFAAAMIAWMANLHGLLPFGILTAVLSFPAGIHYAFSSLAIEIGGGELRWYFGPGVWRNRVPLASIVSIKPDHLPWWYGVGIKYTGRGWAYLVAPGPAVEIVTDNGHVIRLGTDDLEGLMGALATSEQA